jgi:hypothetical protein
MVEGVSENDSFDTSILHDDEEFMISESSDPSQQTGSQPFSIGGSQPWSIGGSQDDSIENFLNKAEDDEQVLLRSPFRPSVPKSVRQSSRDMARHRSPEPEFYMPKIDVESPRRRASTRSTTTVRAISPPPQARGLRRRQGGAIGSEQQRTNDSQTPYAGERASFGDRVSASLAGASLDALFWVIGLVGLALRYAQKPLAVLLSLYVAFGGIIMLQNLATKSFYTALTPICRIPGASLLDLPFCPDFGPATADGEERKPGVEFDSLMDVQEQLGRVVEKSAHGVPLSIEMKRTEASIRDLRILVRYSTLQGKDELLLELDGFVDTVGTVSRDIQKFNARIGSAIDWVISMNRWTSRHLDTLDSGGGEQHQGGLVGAWISRVFSPFQPVVFTERQLVDTYVEHTTLVSDKIAKLIDQAEAVLATLSKAGEHTEAIYDFVARTQTSVRIRRDEILSTLWALVGGSRSQIANLNRQLSLLRHVDAQRSDAIRQLTELVSDLEKIQAALGDLRDRVAEPGLAGGRAGVPLSVHVDTINRGVHRLEDARSRIREIEKDRIQEVLARGAGQEKLIEQS